MYHDTTVINLYGGPGIGKSTTAAGLFNLMKLAEYEVELVTEVAKDWVYDGRLQSNRQVNQILLFALQHQRLFRLMDKVEYIITDSPLLLNNVYNVGNPELRALCTAEYQRMRNIDIKLIRKKPYKEYGRNQTEDEAHALDTIIHTEVDKHTMACIEIEGNPHAAQKIMELLRL